MRNHSDKFQFTALVSSRVWAGTPQQEAVLDGIGNFQELKICGHGTILALTKTHTFWKNAFRSQRRTRDEKKIEAFVNAASEEELAVTESKTSRQDIEIYYSFVGKVDLPE